MGERKKGHNFTRLAQAWLTNFPLQETTARGALGLARSQSRSHILGDRQRHQQTADCTSTCYFVMGHPRIIWSLQYSLSPTGRVNRDELRLDAILGLGDEKSLISWVVNRSVWTGASSFQHLSHTNYGGTYA